MTTTLDRPRGPAPATPRTGAPTFGRRPFASAGRLAITHLRTGWKRFAAWTVALAGVVVITASSIASLYPTAEARATYEQSVGLSPAVAAFNGRPFDLDTLGGITAYEVGAMGQLLVPIVFATLAIRMTRREEDSGRMELIRSGMVGRLAPLASAVQVLALVAVAVVLLIGLGLPAVELSAGGSWLYALSLGIYGFAFGMVALVIAEISNDGRTALGITMIATLAAFLVRAVIDGRGWNLVWLSPIGWVAEARPWGAPQWWPYAAFAALAAIAVTLAGWMTLRRDLGAGLVGSSTGSPRARASLGNPLGFAWRFTRAPFVGWLLGLVILGVVIGSLSNEMTELIAQNPTISEVLGLENPEQLMTVMAVLLSALGSASLGVQGILRIAREEEAGRTALVLSRRVGRVRLWLSWVFAVALEVVVVLFASALATGLATWAATGDSATLGPTFEAGAALLPAVLFIVAVAAAVHAFVPRFAALAWVLVGWAALVGLLGGALDLPDWANSLSPLYAVGNVPLEPASGVAIAVLSVAAVALVAVGARAFRRRDLLAG